MGDQGPYEWQVPNPLKSRGKLYIYNSFTRKKEMFVPLNGNQVKWYNCGPTVYDESHMGHARSYMTFDIIRRILQSYFGYHVMFVQNVTDIDDKIIKRARQGFLFDQFLQSRGKEENNNKEIVMTTINKGLNSTKDKLSAEPNEDKKVMLTKQVTKTEAAITKCDSIPLMDIILQCKDIISDQLDHDEGHNVCDNKVFSSLPQHFERDYDSDMKCLDVLRPNIVTRVSEYVPEIINYIETIITNGFGYEANGSVYFDVTKFDSDPRHSYAKLVHEAVGDLSALGEGEGDLFVTGSDKRSVRDFVLWKKSKPGEPTWPSPWGAGRPGWHIECSVMASLVLGPEIDIHSGGIDLRFPHHDNEIAQSEAFYDTGKDWIKYFIHSGHLHISGCKMSKSLKNFITIKEALKNHTKRQLRLAFLLHPWRETLNYSDDTMADALSYEKYVFEFFLNIKDLSRSSSDHLVKMTSVDLDLNNKLVQTVGSVDERLCDNLDTKGSLDCIKELINGCNQYLKGTKEPNVHLIQDIGSFVGSLLCTFGLIEPSAPEINFVPKRFSDSGDVTNNREEVIMPILEVLANFRSQVRLISLKNQDLLTLCDKLRDDILPELGIRMEDKDNKTVLKIVDRETLLKERDQKRKLEEDKLREKERKKKEAEEKEAKSRMSASDWVKSEFKREDFSAFDDKGIPTHDLDGKEVSKSKRKKWIKDWEKQDLKHKESMAKEKSNGV